MKARDFLICAVAVPVLYLLYVVLGLFWNAGKAVIEFFASIATNPASFTLVGFVLTVLSAVCAVTALREFEENRLYWIESWKELGSQHGLYLRWYAVALGGFAIAVLQFYMLETMPAAPADYGFRAWVPMAGLTAGIACIGSIPLAVGVSLWTFWNDRPTKVAGQR